MKESTGVSKPFKIPDSGSFPILLKFEDSNILLMPTLVPVSYTHLDVYKRQGFYLRYGMEPLGTARYLFMGTIHLVLWNAEEVRGRRSAFITGPVRAL